MIYNNLIPQKIKDIHYIHNMEVEYDEFRGLFYFCWRQWKEIESLPDSITLESFRRYFITTEEFVRYVILRSHKTDILEKVFERHIKEFGEEPPINCSQFKCPPTLIKIAW